MNNEESILYLVLGGIDEILDEGHFGVLLSYIMDRQAMPLLNSLLN